MVRVARPDVASSAVMTALRGLYFMVSVAVLGGEIGIAAGQNCQLRQDLVIIIGTAGTSNVDVLRQLKTFLQTIVLGFPSEVRVGLVRQADGYSFITPLAANRSLVSSNIENLFISGQQIDIAKGLSTAESMFSSVSDPAEVNSVLLILDELSDASMSALNSSTLVTSGAELLTLWIGQSDPPASLSSVATRYYSVAGYHLLLPAIEDVRDVLSPCPCFNGSSVTLQGPDGLTADITLAKQLSSEGVSLQSCATYFEGYNGNIILTCNNTVLRASHNCLHNDHCRAGIQVDLEVLSDSARISDITVSAGAMRLIQCPSQPIGSAISLTVPDGGLMHNGFSVRSCEQQFPEAALVGQLGLLCLQGRPHVFGDCACTRDEVIATESEPGGSKFLLGFFITLLILIVLGSSIIAIFVWTRRQRHTRIRYVSPFHDESRIKQCNEAETQTNVKTWDEVNVQAAPIIAEKIVQTVPQVCVEVSRGSQCPLDLICCIDSSMSVGIEDFLKSKRFAERLVKELELPPVKVGVIRFNDRYTVISPLTPHEDSLLTSLAQMGFEPGETKLGPPLRHAAVMLQDSLAQEDVRSRDQAVIVVTDGDPNDMQETALAAEALRAQGVSLVFVRVGNQVNYETIGKLSSQPADKYVINLGSYNELEDSVEDVLRAVLKVSMWVKRAKCLVDLNPYHTVSDIASVPGYDIMVPGWERHGPDWFFWEPRDGVCLQHDQHATWEPYLSHPLVLGKNQGPGTNNTPMPLKILDHGSDVESRALQDASHSIVGMKKSFNDSFSGSLSTTCGNIGLTIVDPQESASLLANEASAGSRTPSSSRWPVNTRDQQSIGVLDANSKHRVGITGDVGAAIEDFTVEKFRTYLEQRYGSIRAAFLQMDDNRTDIITVTKLVRNLDLLGINRHPAESLFRQLVSIAGCEKRGALNLQDWLRAFGVDHGEENCRRENPLPLLASIDAVIAERRAAAVPSRQASVSSIGFSRQVAPPPQATFDTVIPERRAVADASRQETSISSSYGLNSQVAPPSQPPLPVSLGTLQHGDRK